MRDNEEKWYFRNSVLVIAFLSFGPLALPLLWYNPRFSRKAKIVWSLAIVAATYVFGFVLYSSLQSMIRYYKPVFQDIMSL